MSRDKTPFGPGLIGPALWAVESSSHGSRHLLTELPATKEEEHVTHTQIHFFFWLTVHSCRRGSVETPLTERKNPSKKQEVKFEMNFLCVCVCLVDPSSKLKKVNQQEMVERKRRRKKHNRVYEGTVRPRGRFKTDWSTGGDRSRRTRFKGAFTTGSDHGGKKKYSKETTQTYSVYSELLEFVDVCFCCYLISSVVFVSIHSS